MPDLTYQLTQAQIAFGISVIALVLVYHFLGKNPKKTKKKK